MLIALTGGIGTGKSFVAQMLKERGIEIYDADNNAKRLMLTNKELQQQLSVLIGCEAVVDGRIEKKKIATFLLHSADNKWQLNDVVHPFVARDFIDSHFEWMETAILYESGFDKRVDFDFVVSVSAPNDVRIQRVAKRDNLSIEKASDWVAAQMSQSEIDRRADFVIYNDGYQPLEPQIISLFESVNIRRCNSEK